MIETRALSVTLGGRPILQDVNLKVATGEAVGLVGPNGSGKSTLLRCLLGLVPFTGAAFVDGHDVTREPIRARALVGYLPQRPAFGDATAEEALLFVARLRGVERREVRRALEEVGLEAHATARAKTFSGGMQQRLSLAVALLTQAPLMLLDEPTASLDSEGQETFLQIAQLLRSRGRTLLIASHRNEEISRLTDRVLRVEGGRLHEVEKEAPLRVSAEVLRLVVKGGLR